MGFISWIIMGLIVGVLQDISGPKVRVGKLEEDFSLEKGDRLAFVKEEVIGSKLGEGRYRLCINQSGILAKLKACEFFYLYDGTSTTQLTDNGYADWAPQINDNGYVVWYLLAGG